MRGVLGSIQEQLAIDRQRRIVPPDTCGAAVEFISDGIDLFLASFSEVVDIFELPFRTEHDTITMAGTRATMWILPSSGCAISSCS